MFSAEGLRDMYQYVRKNNNRLVVCVSAPTNLIFTDIHDNIYQVRIYIQIGNTSAVTA